MLGAETGIRGNQLGETAKQQAGADRQRQRERELRDDERTQEPMTSARRCIGTAALFQRLEGRLQSRANCRQDAEHDRCRQRQREPKQQCPFIEPDRLRSRQRCPRQRSQDTDGPVGQHEAADTTEHRKDEPLGHELTDDARGGGAERAAERELALTGAGPRQHQVRDVRARDQQNHRDSTAQHEDHAATLADDLLDEGPHRQRQLLRHLLKE